MQKMSHVSVIPLYIVIGLSLLMHYTVSSILLFKAELVLTTIMVESYNNAIIFVLKVMIFSFK